MNHPVMSHQDWYANWLPALIHWVGNLFGQDWVLPEGALLVIWAILSFTLIAVAAQVAVIFLVLMERKVLAWLTQRKGPNRVGPWGMLQTLADGVKLLFKEDIINKGADKFLFIIGPAVFFLPAFVFYGLIPFTDKLLAVALPAGALFVFAISAISVVGIVLAGWGSNNKYSLLGGMRSAAQAISYEIPLVMAVLGVVLFTGTMNIADIVKAQQGPFWNWFAILLTPMSLLIFFTSALAEVNRIPFDLPEAESELVSGYNTEYGGMKFALFFLAEYASLFAMSAFTAAFFFGGYYSPLGFFLVEKLAGSSAAGMGDFMQLAVQLEMLFWFMLKTYFFIFLAMWIRATLPRLKPDQLMGFSWKFLIPLSLVNVFVIAIEKFLIATSKGIYAKDGVPVGIMQTLPVLSNPTDWMNWGITLVIAGVVFFIFFALMSKLLTQKLEARLARR
jgi:NADH-quinone oxidoreductase subunit H